ncbi:hypothetical protein ACFWPX_29945 [Nocardia sp. NPDC058518]|uniref:hypothetical protein n=1 Tax=Nocardia sp. NPDC058518 TaxID=3346534 RepID=UPI00365B4163
MNDVLATHARAWPPVPMWNRSVAPTMPNRQAPMLWLVGMHGGAGVSSLTASLPFAGDAGTRWPGNIGASKGLDSPFVVAVARTHLHGLVALHNALLSHMNGATPVNTQLAGVITVADSDRPLPKSVQVRRDTIESLAVELGGAAWRLGWIEPWRSLEQRELPAWDHRSATPAKVGDRDARLVPPSTVQTLAHSMYTTVGEAVRRYMFANPHSSQSAAG